MNYSYTWFVAVIVVDAGHDINSYDEVMMWRMQIACVPQGDQQYIDGSLFANYVSEFDKIDFDVVGTVLQIRILYFQGFLAKTLLAAYDKKLDYVRYCSVSSTQNEIEEIKNI